MASCVHDLHIQAAAASTVHRTAHRRRRFLLKLLRKKERKKKRVLCVLAFISYVSLVRRTVAKSDVYLKKVARYFIRIALLQ